MPLTTLISTADVAAHATGDWAFVDCRFRLEDTAWGEREFLTAHLPRAVYAHLDRDLSGPRTGTNGRHPLPEVSRAIETFGRLGIGSGTQVVAYDQDTGMFASRLWWMLRWLGHDEVAVLDGGFARWLAEGRPTESGPSHASTRTFTGAPRQDMLAELQDVATGTSRLVDARAPERFRGEVEPIDRVPGHIPGAINHFFLGNLRADGTMRSPEDLRVLWEGTLEGHEAGEVIAYCGSGVTACQNLLALEHAGLSGARLYPG
ncbi:MAG: sulfurtransferase, partial [Vicinamibacterales bacterium]